MMRKVMEDSTIAAVICPLELTVLSRGATMIGSIGAYFRDTTKTLSKY